MKFRGVAVGFVSGPVRKRGVNTSVMTNQRGTMQAVANKPAMRLRSVRVSDKLWEAASDAAEARHENLSDVIREALEQYVQRAESEI